MKKNTQNERLLAIDAATKRVASYLHKQLQRPDIVNDNNPYIALPDGILSDLSESQVKTVCERINDHPDLPAIMSRRFFGGRSNTLAEKSSSLQVAHERRHPYEIQAKPVHASLKKPLVEYKGSYVFGRFPTLLGWRGFVGKVINAHTDGNKLKTHELAISVAFYVDEEGTLSKPKKGRRIRSDRATLQYFFGALTRRQLASLKTALVNNPDFSKSLASTSSQLVESTLLEAKVRPGKVTNRG